VRCFVFLAGALISGSRQAYRYLADSTVNYFTPEELKQFLQRAGFSRVNYYRLLFGAVSIHIAIK
jgi:demethylmenaquinone methyltransferase/2-methoxy-6-polyprenyl-1,4-benzoquinol methylase